MAFVKKAVVYCRELLESFVAPGDTVVDATAGNGIDTLLLSELVGSEGVVYAFDIQEDALESARMNLEKSPYKNVIFINDGHENMDRYIDSEPAVVTFNLGYLPGGERKIITRADTTLTAVNKSLKMLKNNGIITIVCYTGHPGGEDERNLLCRELANLNQKQFTVLSYSFINQVNYPPELIVIEKNI